MVSARLKICNTRSDRFARRWHGAWRRLFAAAAAAADHHPAAAVQEFASNWYLRGFVGAGMNGNYTLDYLPDPANVGNGFVFQHNSIADTFFVGGGVGYEWNNWLRFDFTGEYRARTRVYAFGTYPPNDLDTYEGYLKTWVLLANAYVDLGTWNCFTPFVGFGIGGAHIQLADFSDVNPDRRLWLRPQFEQMESRLGAARRRRI